MKLSAFLIPVSLLTTFLAIGLAETPAQAGWHHRHGCGSCGTCAHCRHGRHRGCHGCAGGSYGGGSHGGGSHGGGSSGGSPGAGAPKAAESAPAASAAKKVAWTGPADGAMLAIAVPEGAKLSINGNLTELTGAVRHFTATGLADDKKYQYELKMVVDGKDAPVEQTKTVWLVAGEEQTVVFDGADATAIAQRAPMVPTTLTLRVPADARVWIEGRLTEPTGAVRNFSTDLLSEGQTWDGYEIRVASMVDGREVSTVRRVRLTGGRNLELAIDPASNTPSVETTASVR